MNFNASAVKSAIETTGREAGDNVGSVTKELLLLFI